MIKRDNVRVCVPRYMQIGKGSLNQLPEIISIIGSVKSLLIVTDKQMLKFGYVKKLQDILSKAGFKSNVFDDTIPDPTDTVVLNGIEILNKNKNDAVIGFGGGSPIDTAKAIAVLSQYSKNIQDYKPPSTFDKKGLPIIAIPTTAGTGSETGRASAIINSRTGIKKIIFHPKFLPSVVILDPVLTKELSPRLTGATGMDALAHNLEAFCAPGFHPMADGIAIEGMRLIKKSLLKAVKNGSDLDARSDLLAAASMGSTAFQKGLGAIHSLSHPLNAQFNLHHGLSNAIFMPYVLSFNKEDIEERIISICDYLNLSKSFDAFLEWILELRKELNIPHKLSDLIEAKKMNLDDLSNMALDDPSTSSNPKKLTINDMKVMYEHSISGDLF